jgi:methylated-DNA-[protein]-cysteine S-methyltransferase
VHPTRELLMRPRIRRKRLRIGVKGRTMRRCTVIESPIGHLTIEADRSGSITALSMAGWYRQAGRDVPVGTCDPEYFDSVIQQLHAYFAGTRTEFALSLAPAGNEFQQSVWRLLRQIPYGETRSYGQLAAALGDRSLARAVGSACGANPIGVIIPCHRVIGADGRLTGFGGGIETKAWLLHLENPSKHPSTPRLFA